MKLLLLHSSYLEFEPHKKAVDSAEDYEKGKERVEECLVVFNALEKEDVEDLGSVAGKADREIRDVADKVGVDRIVIYPWVHLTSKPGSAGKALDMQRMLEEKLEEDFEVTRSPFGWYKEFEIHVKGHPLAELSREISPGETEADEEVSEVEEDGTLEEVKVIMKDGTLKKRHEVKDDRVQTAIKAETGEFDTGGGEPPHLKLMRKLELIDRETRISDSGNMRYYPKGQMIIELMMDLGEQICTRDLNGVKTRTPYIIDPNQENVKIMMEKFPERLYKVLPGSGGKNREFRLRPACDYGAWSMMKDMVMSYRNLPLGLYEEDLFWRYEQRGELVGLNRLRHSTMANLHTICKDMDGAFREFEKQVKRFAIKLYDHFGISPEIVVLNCKKDFFQEHEKTFKMWAKSFDMPVIVKLFRSMKTYKIAWVDVIAFDELERPVEVDTVQLDTESPKWWDITYVGEDGEEKYPLIIHTGFGPERFLSAVLENTSAKENPVLPVWLSPTQVRIIPVSSEKHMDYCVEVADELEKEKIRVDIDDRPESVGRRIRDSETEWIPYMLVVGDNEIDGDELSVRIKETGEEIKMTMEELIEEIKDKTEGYPYKRLPLPKLVSKRPKFVG